MKKKDVELEPIKPGTFEREKVDLNCLLYSQDVRMETDQWDQVYGWLESELTQHRAQAYAHGVEAGRRQKSYGISAMLADFASGLTPVLLALALVLLVILG